MDAAIERFKRERLLPVKYDESKAVCMEKM
jgi:hypothetical protein